MKQSSKLNYVVFNILTVLGYFYGVALCATLILIPVGVYSVIAAHRFSSYADMSAADFAYRKKYATAWIIFGCVMYFPFGLIGLLCLPSATNGVYVSDVQAESSAATDTNSDPAVAEPQTAHVSEAQPLTEAERAEKLEKLKRFKQNGLITEEEYNQAVDQLK